MTDLRKAAEIALEALETLWDILDDIDTASDMAKENNAWYRKRVEALQKKRWDTTITTDGYKLKGGPVEALRQALQPKLEWFPAPTKTEWGEMMVKTSVEIDSNHYFDVYCEESQKHRVEQMLGGTMTDQHQALAQEEKPPVKSYCGGKPNYCTPVDAVNISQERVDETAKRKREWVGLTEVDIYEAMDFDDEFDFAKAIEAKLKEKNT